jgi:hypothetical protein
MKHSVCIEASDCDVYVFPIETAVPRGKEMKTYVFSCLERYHPCFSDRFCFRTSRFRQKGKSFVVTAVVDKIVLAEYRMRHPGKRVYVQTSNGRIGFPEPECYRKSIRRFLSAAGICLPLIAIAAARNTRLNDSKAESFLDTGIQENASAAFNHGSTSIELPYPVSNQAEKECNPDNDILDDYIQRIAILLSSSGAGIEYFSCSVTDTKSVIFKISGMYPEYPKLAELFSQLPSAWITEVSTVSYRDRIPVFTVTISCTSDNSEFQEIIGSVVSREKHAVNTQRFRDTVLDNGGELTREAPDSGLFSFRIPTTKIAACFSRIHNVLSETEMILSAAEICYDGESDMSPVIGVSMHIGYVSGKLQNISDGMVRVARLFYSVPENNVYGETRESGSELPVVGEIDETEYDVSDYAIKIGEMFVTTNRRASFYRSADGKILTVMEEKG